MNSTRFWVRYRCCFYSRLFSITRTALEVLSAPSFSASGRRWSSREKGETKMTDIRKETDSLGEVDVPADKLWGEKAAANANHASGRLDAYLQASASLRTSQ